METLKLTLIVLPIIEIAIFIWLIIRKDMRQKRTSEESKPIDNEPAYCEDYERIFYNP